MQNDSQYVKLFIVQINLPPEPDESGTVKDGL